MLEMSSPTSIGKETAEKKVGTDVLPPPERSSKNKAAPNDTGQERNALKSQPKQEGHLLEKMKKKAKMRRTKLVSAIFSK